VEEVRTVLAEAEREGLGVVPLGAGTDPGCEPPRGPFVALVTDGLSGIEDYEPADLTVSARAGTKLGELAAALAEHAQWVPSDPPFVNRRSLGGVVASGASGALGTSFGAVRDHVLGLTVVTGDGRVLHLGGRVMKNVAGFDLVRLVVGSRGALGVVVSATLRVFPRPEVDRLFVLQAAGLEELLPVTEAVRSAPVLPASAVLSVSGEGPTSLVVRVQGAQAAVESDARRILGHRREAAQSYSVDEDDGQAALAAARDGASRGSLVVRMSSLPDALPATLASLSSALPGAEIRADVLTGSVRACSQAEAAADTVRALRLGSVSMGGSLVIERASTAVVEEVGAYANADATAGLSRDLKRTFDPGGLLSPGRFVT
jgi:glycolate oxidase FAD binding subunit